jgi:periplasmic copper chaperone A
LRSLAALVTACLALLAAAAAAQSPLLTAQDAWIRLTPGSDVAAAYLTLHNAGTQPLSISGVRSPRAASAMIHETQISNGQSRMRPHEPLAIAAGATVRLAPGGLHIMLHGLTGPLQPGDQVPLVLQLEGGGSVTVSARVRALGDG